ncbi:MAG: D-2-hydroxyacid dehydrogenase [Chromatiales bacterium]|nr:D-2-hydroxyacid dehydrogenase [Chromatiales bacterium]
MIEENIDQLVSRLELRELPYPVREHPLWRPPRRIVVWTDASAPLEFFAPTAPGVELVGVNGMKQAVAAMPGADAVIGVCTKEMFGAADELRWIQLYLAGIGMVATIPAVQERGLLVTNMQRVSGPDIAEHVIALLFGLARGLHRYQRAQQQGSWRNGLVKMDQVMPVEDGTLLVVGLGGIGGEVARRARSLGMQVLGIRANGEQPHPNAHEVAGPGQLTAFAARADVVVNATPLTPLTEQLYDAAFFSAMRRDAFFINVGRGRSVVQPALVAALESGLIAGAALDVTDPEPLPADDCLWQMENVIVTPHVSGFTGRVRDRIYLVARENLRRYVSGEPLLSPVDLKAGY